MANLNVIELKTFVPAKRYSESKAFYADVGFTQASDTHGVSFFHLGDGGASFLLQDFYEKTLAESLVMHLLVEDIGAWHKHLISSGIKEKYQTSITEITEQPWGMQDFIMLDPSGVMWRIAQNK
ncbi:VOC family protein [Marinomonas sp. PE14-40]|uniref:VOC family protein n=1 Tax=Marinomonas sp. PE14-40 TaxID=3060621 RepID=UPI003F681139